LKRLSVHRPEYLKLIDTQTPGPRCDVTPLFADPTAFAALLDDFVALLHEIDFDVVAGIDALGFILGAALALWTRKGFVPVRKGGKLPVPVDMVEFIDYSGESKALELRRDAIAPGSRVLIVDEWIETGAQMAAAVRLIEGRGGVVAGIATIHIDDNEKTRTRLGPYRCYQIWPDA
jgi:adenine phosphoribosyltransferase